MIYIAIGKSSDNYADQHKKAHSLLASLLNSLGYGNIDVKKRENGRPYVEQEGLDISLSHSSRAVIAAVLAPDEIESEDYIALPYTGKSIGVDLEEIPENGDITAKNRLANRFFNASISSLEEFYRLWTRNEAYGKMTGEGVICMKSVPCQLLSLIVAIDEKKYSMSISIEQ